MKTLPMFLKTTGQKIAIIGGGEQATQKARLALKTDATITIFSDAISEELEAARANGTITWIRKFPNVKDLKGVRILFIALDCPGAGASMASLGREAGAIVNMVDAPAWSDAYTPSIVDRDPIVVAIGTEGSAPMLGRRIRGHLEEMLPEGLGDFAAYAGSLRPRVARHLEKTKRMGFWRRFFSPAIRDRFISGDAAGVSTWVDSALKQAETPSDRSPGQAKTKKRVTLLVMPLAGNADLLSLRAARRLQETDFVIHPSGADPLLLDMARRDAERRPWHGGLARQSPPTRAIARLILDTGQGGHDITALLDSREQAEALFRQLLPEHCLNVELLDAGSAGTEETPISATKPLSHSS